MATSAPLFFRMHCDSHWLSWGQTRPQTAGRQFFSLSLLMPEAKSPLLAKEMNPGISISTGQPLTQRGFLHCMHRFASAMTISCV